MGTNRALVFVLPILLGLAPLMGHAEEELFDTKAAAEHIEKGIAQLKAKSFDAAIVEFEESASISPEAEPYYYLGYAYYLKGRSGEDGESRKLSRENFEKAYEIDPNYSPTRYKPAEPVPAKPEPEEGERQAPADAQ
ncbi:MAG: hypothetical protein ACM3MD_03140 [Betaproteobacteria bacterium]